MSELATAYCAGVGGAMAYEMAQVFAVVEDEIRVTRKVPAGLMGDRRLTG